MQNSREHLNIWFLSQGALLAWVTHVSELRLAHGCMLLKYRKRVYRHLKMQAQYYTLCVVSVIHATAHRAPTTPVTAILWNRPVVHYRHSGTNTSVYNLFLMRGMHQNYWCRKKCQAEWLMGWMASLKKPPHGCCDTAFLALIVCVLLLLFFLPAGTNHNIVV